MESRPSLLQRVLQIEPTGRATRLIAIDGQGGAGKSSLAGWLTSEVDGSVVHVDDFGRPGKPYDDWDWHRLNEQVLSPLLEDRTATFQIYDWAADELGTWAEVEAGGVVIVEGVSVLRKELGDPWDLKVWVEAPYDLRLQRGVDRDGEPMRETWVSWWMPQEDAYVLRDRPIERADIIVPGH